MKKRFKFFLLGFFSDKEARGATKGGYTSVFLGFVLALVFLFTAFVGGEMLPFATRYGSAADFADTAYSALIGDGLGIDLELKNGTLMAKRGDGEYTEALIVDTIGRASDREKYSVGGYELVIDTRSADTLALVEAYCVSNDGKGLVISYEEYLTLGEVARLNFDFKLRYTNDELVLDSEAIRGYEYYLLTLDSNIAGTVNSLKADLASGNINEESYARGIYTIYFESYYPSISDYESTSKLPLLRNYYYHEYLSEGQGKYLFIFDDYLAGSFETVGGGSYSFYGYYSGMADGAIVPDGLERGEAERRVDEFLKDAYGAVLPLMAYSHGMNLFSMIPFIALMPLVVTLLAYSILKLSGSESIRSFGDAFKIIGSFIHVSGLLSALLSMGLSFFVPTGLLGAMPPVLFFLTLAARAVIFCARVNREDRERYATVHTEE